MLKISVPETTNVITKVSLNGKNFDFFFKYNDTVGKHFLDIFYDKTLIIAGIQLSDGAFLIGKYALDIFEGGDLLVVKMKDTDEPVGRHNLGIDKPYELIYLSPQDMAGSND